MNRATGIHLFDSTLRFVSLESSASGYRLCALTEARLPVPFRAQTLRDDGGRQRLAGAIGEALSGGEGGWGDAIASLGGGFFQIQKVPLEVASEEDRKRQIMWEVSQALISPAEDYIVDFYPAGRTAFWVAIRREVADLCVDLYRQAGISLKGFEVEPIALFHACALAAPRGEGRNAAILLGNPWLSFVAADGGLLMAAETTRINWQDVSQNRKDASGAACEEGVPGGLQDASEVARRWIYGDLTPDRRRTAYQHVYLCGEDEGIRQLVKGLRSPSSPQLTPLQPFSDCDTHDLPEDQRPYLARQCAFGVAAGLAYRGLKHGA